MGVRHRLEKIPRPDALLTGSTMSAPIMQNHVTLQIGTILALVSAVAVGAMRVSNIEAKADRAFEEVVETKAQLN
jgi:hypothetical protein